MKILINATAAKELGALTIIESYVRNLDPKLQYFLLSPFKPDYLSANTKWIRCETNSIFTSLFSLFFVAYYAATLRVDKIVSFSNLNVAFDYLPSVTYFHQALILSSNKLKFKMLRVAIKIFNKHSVFIVQTNFMKSEFRRVFGNEYQVHVLWPGLNIPELSQDLDSKSQTLVNYYKAFYDYVFIIPVANTYDDNKNLKLFFEYADLLLDKQVLILVPSHINCFYSNFENLVFIGPKSRCEFLSILKVCDGVLVFSKLESLGLPIFESIYLGRKSIVFAAEYALSLQNEFSNINNLYLFHDGLSLSHALDSNLKPVINIECISRGSWGF